MDTTILDAKTYNEMAKKFTLLDDIFMTKVFENDTRLTAFVLKIILNRELKVMSVKVQDDITNLHGHSVCLDVHAISADGKHFNIEVQKENRGAIPRRARYNSSILDANILPAGKDYRFLPETYIIFITKRDVLKLGEPIYFIERMIVGKNKLFDDGAHIVYVNNSIRDDTPLGKLMHDFDCKNPDKMFYEIIADKVSEHKIFERSGYKMAGSIEKWINKKAREIADEKARETAEQVRRETAEQVRRETAEQVRRETAEQVRRETAEQVRRETAEQVRRETAEQVRRETAEQVRRETAEQVRRETVLESALNTAKSLIAIGKLTLEEIASICKLPLKEVQALAAAK